MSSFRGSSVGSASAFVLLLTEREARFRELAASLRDRSRHLRDEAANRATKELGDQLASVREMCDACHREFRVLPAVSGS